jgi:hypothetical protein
MAAALLATFICIPALANGVSATGIVFEDGNGNGVFDAGEHALPDVVVSDGMTVVVTGDAGRYEIGTDPGRIIFVSVPGSHHAPGNRFYGKSESAATRIDFPLVRNADADAPEQFTFVFVTDTHVADYRGAKEGVRKAYETIAAERPDLVVHGGDIVFDAFRTSDEAFARRDFDMYKNDLAPIITMPFYHTLGNHDVFGWMAPPESQPPWPPPGKKIFAEYFGPTHYSFNYKHCHFVILDSIGRTENEGKPDYFGFVDPAQIEWLRRDLETVDPARPIVVVTHIPMVNALASWYGVKGETIVAPDGERTAKHQVYGFQRLMSDALQGRNFKLALAGHFHTFEDVHWKTNEHDAHFIVGGAVCGEWWKGDRAVGPASWPEGFTRITVSGDDFDVSYVSYGWTGTEEGS